MVDKSSRRARSFVEASRIVSTVSMRASARTRLIYAPHFERHVSVSCSSTVSGRVSF